MLLSNTANIALRLVARCCHLANLMAQSRATAHLFWKCHYRLNV